MEAKDTVTTLSEVDKIGLTEWEQGLILRHKAQQAEISFKMGYNQALKDIKAGLSPSDIV